jgi:2-polyprenyl-6-methoxyphenol hydroxylase-like FAD-dependent oxidoreductase
MTSSLTASEALAQAKGDAIIIGGGPAGLSCALGLARVCRQVHVVEKHKEFESRGSTFNLAANGRKALGELDSKICDTLTQLGLETPSGGLLMVWFEMRDALLKRVRQLENVQIHTGESITNILDQEDNEGQVAVEFQSGLVLHGDFVVGADGVKSTVRALLGRPPAVETESRVFRGTVDVDIDSCSTQLKDTLTKGIAPLGAKTFPGVYFLLFNFHSKRPGRMAWVLSTTKDASENKNVTPMSLLQPHVTDPDEWRLLEEILELSDARHLKKFPPTCVMDFSENVLEDMNGGWGGNGKVTLVGDAAHAMRPTDGQGGNLAFEDAVVLFRLVRDAASRKRPIQEILHEFEATRLPRVKRIHDDQRMRYEARMRGEQAPPMTKEFMEWVGAGV